MSDRNECSVYDAERPKSPNMCDPCGISQGERAWCEYCGLDTTPGKPMSAPESTPDSFTLDELRLVMAMCRSANPWFPERPMMPVWRSVYEKAHNQMMQLQAEGM